MRPGGGGLQLFPGGYHPQGTVFPLLGHPLRVAVGGLDAGYIIPGGLALPVDEVGKLFVVKIHGKGQGLVRVHHGSLAAARPGPQGVIEHLLHIAGFRGAKHQGTFRSQALAGDLIPAGGGNSVHHQAAVGVQERIACIAVVHKHQGRGLLAFVFDLVMDAQGVVPQAGGDPAAEHQVLAKEGGLPHLAKQLDVVFVPIPVAPGAVL